MTHISIPRPPRATFAARRARAAALVALALASVAATRAAAQAAPAFTVESVPAPRAPLDAGRREAQLSTGVRLGYLEQGDPAGPVVILLHGYGDTRRSFGRVLPLLPRALHVFALDQRGHGDSERPIGGYAMHDLAADVVAFMDAQGIARATLVGHSMGSFVAQQVALRAHDRVERLVLVASATAPRTAVGIDELVETVRAFDAPHAPVTERFARAFQEGTVHAPVPAAFMDEMVAGSLKPPARVWRAALDGMLDAAVPTGLADRRIPTLLLWGDRDAYFPRSEQDALLRLLPTATLTTYPRTGHAPHWERPEAVARDLAAFILAAPR